MRAGRAQGPIAFGTFLCLALCAASYWKSDFTTNDFERFGDLRLTFFFFAVFVGLIAVHLGVAAREEPPGPLRLGAVLAAFGLPLLVSFPVGSKDVFAYAFYGKMWGAYGADPYLHPPSAFGADPWFRFIDAWWNQHTITYGPLFVLQTRLVYACVGDRLALTVAAYKLLDLVFVVAAIGPLASLFAVSDAERHSAGERDGGASRRAVMLWAWSPLVLFETLGAGHNDVAMALLILVAALCWTRDRWLLAGAFFALSFWYKWYSVVLLPVWIAWSLRRWRLPATVRRVALGLAGFGLVSAAVVAPFGDSLAEVLRHGLGHKVVHLIFPDEMPPPLWIVFRALVAFDLFHGDAGLALLDVFRVGLFGGGVAWLLWRRRGQAYEPGRLLEDLFWTLALFFGFAVTVLYPWHLLPACALALASARRRLQRVALGLTAMALLSYFLTWRYALVLCVLVVAALSLLRRRREEVVATVP